MLKTAGFLVFDSGWAHDFAHMLSRLANQPVVADDGGVGLLRRLYAPLFETGLEGAERVQPRNRTGPVLSLGDAEMDEHVVAKPCAKVSDIIWRFRAQLLKHRLDQVCVLLGHLKLRPVAYHGQLHSMLPQLQFRSSPLKTSRSPGRMRANKHFSCAESFGNHGSSSWHEPLNCSRE